MSRRLHLHLKRDMQIQLAEQFIVPMRQLRLRLIWPNRSAHKRNRLPIRRPPRRPIMRPWQQLHRLRPRRLQIQQINRRLIPLMIRRHPRLHKSRPRSIRRNLRIPNPVKRKDILLRNRPLLPITSQRGNGNQGNRSKTAHRSPSLRPQKWESAADHASMTHLPGDP